MQSSHTFFFFFSQVSFLKYTNLCTRLDTFLRSTWSHLSSELSTGGKFSVFGLLSDVEATRTRAQLSCRASEPAKNVPDWETEYVNNQVRVWRLWFHAFLPLDITLDRFSPCLNLALWENWNYILKIKFHLKVCMITLLLWKLIFGQYYFIAISGATLLFLCLSLLVC